MLIVTPDEHEEKHIQVMAGLCAMASDPIIRRRLSAAIDPHDAWEIIEHEEIRNYNYFLED
jgi:mannitol/fructose-specific phosphotransferase system IIA component (Ntr-type)